MTQWAKPALIAAVWMAASPLAAQVLETWGMAGGWDVMIDQTLGDGCLIQAAYTDGSLVRIGFDRLEGSGYVTTFNDAWGDIEEGAEYDITFALDGENYQGVATGIYLNGVPGANIYFDNVVFPFDIAQRYSVTLYHADFEVMAIDLEGTYVDLEEALACQDEMV